MADTMRHAAPSKRGHIAPSSYARRKSRLSEGFLRVVRIRCEPIPVRVAQVPQAEWRVLRIRNKVAHRLLRMRNNAPMKGGSQ
jgi:hypothetical protein